MDDSLFLVANIGVDTALSETADWVIATGEPYTHGDPVDVPFSATSELFTTYLRTYEKLGTHLKNPMELFEYNRWILVRDGDDKLVAFVIFKTTPWGLKLGVVGSDGSRRGKECLLALLTMALNVEGVYGEISPPLEDKLTNKIPLVSARTASKVLEKDIEPEADGYHYRRDIKGIGSQTKLLVGRPAAKFSQR